MLNFLICLVFEFPYPFLQMCGNGVRCFAKFLAELDNLQGKQSFIVHTGAGLIVPEIQEDGKVKVDMGVPILNAADVPTKLPTTNSQPVVNSRLDVDGVSWNVTCVSMGNPHCVTFSKEGTQGTLKMDTLVPFVSGMSSPEMKPSDKTERLGIARLALHYAHMITQIYNILKICEFKEDLSATQIEAQLEKTLKWLVPVATETARSLTISLTLLLVVLMLEILTGTLRKQPKKAGTNREATSSYRP
ncbi:hypothetical protein POM88_029016 [Heracleum sosnowskyi]|uniref:Uncharacterized protein n=1 Tax=Heracleum sosnowskyi TaxID=360622 RepID=A0AAD8HUZ3_9APIA|nr:hypothetical protein POM88_029016 [Heracleum sosnowskyi]